MHGPRSVVNMEAVKISMCGHITFFQYFSYQNRNQYNAALFLYDVEDTHLHVVQSKLMDKCYAYMEKGSIIVQLPQQGHLCRCTYGMTCWTSFRLACSKSGKNKISYAYKTESLHYTHNVNLKI